MSPSTATKRAALLALLAALASLGFLTQVSLTTQVKGILPVANGGSGVATAAGHSVFAGPTGGFDAAPAFRALVTGDIPSLAALYDALGSAATAQSNAETFAANAANITTGTLPNARLSAIPNSALANSSTTVSGQTCPLGGSCTVPVPAATWAFGGDGHDAAVTLDGTNTYSGLVTTTGSAPNFVYTLARDAYTTSLTVSSGKTLKTANYKIFSTGTVDAEGTITNQGTVGPNGGNAPGQSGGGAGSGAVNTSGGGNASTADPTPAAPAGGNTGGTGNGVGAGGNGNQGGAGSAGSQSVCDSPLSGLSSGAGGLGGTGALGGSGTVGASGTAGGTPGSATPKPNYVTAGFNNGYFTGLSSNSATSGRWGLCSGTPGGAGGGAAGGAGGASTPGGGGGGGGSSGGAGGWLVVYARSITVGASGSITTAGQTGGNGGNGAAGQGGNSGGGGGGGAGTGGNGGILFTVATSYTLTGTFSSAGGSPGTPGSGGAGSGTGTGGATGGAGSTGRAGLTVQLTVN